MSHVVGKVPLTSDSDDEMILFFGSFFHISKSPPPPVKNQGVEHSHPKLQNYCAPAAFDRFSAQISACYARVSPVLFQADNILNKLNEKMAPGYVTNRDEFIAHLTKDAKFKPFGKLVHSYAVSKGETYIGVSSFMLHSWSH